MIPNKQLAATLETMKVGDVMAAGNLFPGLDDEPLEWQMLERTPSGRGSRVVLVGRYAGVYIKQLALFCTKDGVTCNGA